VPGYRLNGVDFHALTLRKTLALPQPVTTIVVVISIPTFGSETASQNADGKRAAERTERRNHVVLAQILGHGFPIKADSRPSFDSSQPSDRPGLNLDPPLIFTRGWVDLVGPEWSDGRG